MADQSGKISWQDFFSLQEVKADVKEELIRQLEKDLQVKIEPPTPDGIFKKISESLRHAESQGALQQLLYRIDLSEQEAASAFRQSDPIHYLSFAVLKREAQKVLFRKQFSGG